MLQNTNFRPHCRDARLVRPHNWQETKYYIRTHRPCVPTIRCFCNTSEYENWISAGYPDIIRTLFGRTSRASLQSGQNSTGMDIGDKYVVEHIAKFSAFRYFK